MDKEKLEKLWKMVEYVGEKKGLDYNEMIVFGSVFGQLEAEILRLQKENTKIEKLYEGGILDIECLKDDAEERQSYIDELEQSISFAKFQSDLQVKNIVKLKDENEKIRWSGMSLNPGSNSKVKVLKSYEQVKKGVN